MQTFGVEIECILPARTTRTDTAMAITAAGVLARDADYTHAIDRAFWKVVRDGSLSTNGQELVSPPLALNEASFAQVTIVCAVLRGLQATVNKSCGLHVHIGAQHLSVEAVKRLALMYAEYEPAIDSLIPPSRRASNNSYCRSVVTSNKRAINRALGVADVARAIGDRRVKLNFHAYHKYGTVEFRHHSGTIDPVKVIAWIKMCAKMVEAAARDGAAPIAEGPPAVGDPRYWEKGKRRRVLFQLLCRPEGVTREELRQHLGLNALPSIKPHLVRSGAPQLDGWARARERRGGHEVFRLEPQELAAAVAAANPATLTSLLDKLQLPEADRAFWLERAELMARALPPAE